MPVIVRRTLYNPPMLETTPEDFVERHRHAAARGTLYPQPEGSPLLEFVSGGRVLYLLDRCGPYAAPPGEAQVIVNGVLTRWQQEAGGPETLSVLGVSALEGCGQVIVPAGAGQPNALVLRARLPLVLSAYSSLREFAAGDWLSFSTEAPLHGFVLTGPALRQVS